MEKNGKIRIFMNILEIDDCSKIAMQTSCILQIAGPMLASAYLNLYLQSTALG